ncbi:MAG: GTPase Era [Acidobacteriota bacterium]
MREDVVSPGSAERAAPATLVEAGLDPGPDHRSGFVTLFGRSNVGKSTLVNTLVGQKVAIVTEAPQTTRCRIRAIASGPDAQIIYLDTPGIHKPHFAMNRRMVATAVAALEGVDLVGMVIDGAAGLGPGDRYAMGLVQKRKKPVFLLINKIDQMAKNRILETIAAATRDYSFAEVIPVSARTGENTDRLQRLIRESLPVGPRYFPAATVTDAPEKFLMAEILREKIIQNSREELPHSSAVIVERVEERSDGLVEMDTLVVVEKKAHKGMVLGKAGETMKRIASASRAEMEAHLGTRVFLKVWVKVAPNWRMDRRFLDRLGLENLSYRQAGLRRNEPPPASREQA